MSRRASDHAVRTIKRAVGRLLDRLGIRPHSQALKESDHRVNAKDLAHDESPKSGLHATAARGAPKTATKDTSPAPRNARNSGANTSGSWITSRRAGRRQRKPGPSRSRPLHLGIDYGTSTSKLVLTDYASVEGERSFVVRPQLQPETSRDFRIPSTVSYDNGTIRFGYAAESCERPSATLYRSLKMRIAYRDQYYGNPAETPFNLTELDLATLYIGHLVQVAQQSAIRYADQFRSQPSLAVTLGVPMAQLDHTPLQNMFVGMVRQAFRLRDKIALLDAVSSIAAEQALATVREELSKSSLGEPRDWVRSEAEAALFWAHSSPDIPDGRYACVDVGAGTTNASWFHINSMRMADMADVVIKDRLSFYAADCAPPGCDAIDAILAEQLHLPGIAAARGKESELLEDLSTNGSAGIADVLEAIAEVYGNASVEAFKKEESQAAWRDVGRIFLLGGGSKIQAVRDKLVAKRRDWLKTNPIAYPGVPSSLTEEDGSELEEDPTFLMVAYGLARRLADVPDISRPSEINPYKPKYSVRNHPSHEDLYTD